MTPRPRDRPSSSSKALAGRSASGLSRSRSRRKRSAASRAAPFSESRAIDSRDLSHLALLHARKKYDFSLHGATGRLDRLGCCAGPPLPIGARGFVAYRRSPAGVKLELGVPMGDARAAVMQRPALPGSSPRQGEGPGRRAASRVGHGHATPVPRTVCGLEGTPADAQDHADRGDAAIEESPGATLSCRGLSGSRGVGRRAATGRNAL